MPSLYISQNSERRAREAVATARQDIVAFAKAFLGFHPSPKQEEWLRRTERVQVAIAGRRFGKSSLSLIKAMHACLTRPNQQWFVAAPSIDQARIYFRELERFRNENPLLQRLMPHRIAMAPFPSVTFMSGSVLEARSTSLDGMYLRGFGADGVVVTEAAFIKDVVWYEVIQALLLDRRGTAIIETTPNGTGNWTYELFRSEDPTVGSFHATCFDNPRLDELDIERIRRTTPELAFRQEYLAEFVDDDAAVFPWKVLQPLFDDDAVTVPGKPEPEHRYVIGVDLAKHRDFTVICTLDITSEPYTIAAWHRTQNVRYMDIADLVNRTAEEFGASIYLDATGVGEAVSEHVPNANRVVFTPKLREEIISGMVVDFEQRKVMLPPSLDVLRDELRYFRRVEHGSVVKAEAVSGQHDDAVMALGLALHGARAGGYAGLEQYYREMRAKVIPLRRA